MIAQSFDESFNRVQELVAKFRQDPEYYLSPSYNETAARQDFIDEFWIALGWDVRHQLQTNPYEQDVKVERNVNVSGRGKRADYAFLAPNFRDVRFFVEAKKPSRNIDNRDDYFQTIRYGWHNQTPLSVLTDFEQLRVLDCRYKPDIDTALKRAVKKFHFSDYEDPAKFGEIYHLFSREAVINGSLERFAETLPKVSGKAVQRKLFGGGFQSIDESFLQDLDEYRAQLARSFKNRNPQLGGAELTEVTQRALDRLVFMRFLEDKLIEQQPLVENFGTRGTAWQDFIAESRRLDQIYNGIIFKKHDLLDSPDFKIDDRVFEDIRESLSHTNSSYDFNLIPIHILGSIYERFLGKTIVATNKQARVEDKPEVRKAGGVYYTPEYIVRYIVENTVGKLIAGKTPEQIAEMRFADIACGSGSFLLGVYDLLLRHHTAYYNRNKTNREKGAKAGCLKRDDGTLQLSLKQKQAILVNNIYGVDIDQQAVEVAQLSLYLKLLEEETTATSRAYQLEFGQRLLPTLSQNIVSGNSLIGWDILEGKLFPDEEERKLNPMDFESVFPDIMKRGGFDAIVGNPPYVRSINLKESNPLLWNLYRERYQSASSREWDIYLIFVEKALTLLKPAGKLGYILPNKFLNSQVGENLRSILSSGKYLERLIHFGAFQIFDKATTYTCLLFLNRMGCDQLEVARYTGQVNKSGIPCPMPEQALDMWSFSTIPFSQLSASEWNFSISGSALLEKIKQWPALENVAQVFQGAGTRADKVYLLEYRGREDDLVRVYSHEQESEYLLEPFYLKPALRGRSIGRYEVSPPELLLLVPYEVLNGRYSLPSERRLAEVALKTRQYLLECKSRLNERENGRFKGEQWFCYGRPQNMDRFEVTSKIVLPDIANRGACFLDVEQRWILDTAYAITLKNDVNIDLRYILAILNSPLLTCFLKETGTALRGGYFRMKTAYLNPFPLRIINFSDPEDKARHDRMVQMVEHMLEARQQLAQSLTDRDKAFYENKCAALDRQIDHLVYELYNLTDDEIAIVEAAG